MKILKETDPGKLINFEDYFHGDDVWAYEKTLNVAIDDDHLAYSCSKWT